MLTTSYYNFFCKSFFSRNTTQKTRQSVHEIKEEQKKRHFGYKMDSKNIKKK